MKYAVEYRALGSNEWLRIPDAYDTFNRAATIATAIGNRAHIKETRIVEFDLRPRSFYTV